MDPLAPRPNTTPRGPGDDQRLTKHPLTVHDTGASTSRWRSQTLAALRHLAGDRTPWQDPEVERRGRAGDKRRRPKGLRRSHADRHALTSRWRSQTLATLGPSLRSGPRNARRLNNGGVKRGGAGGRKDGKQAGWPRHRKRGGRACGFRRRKTLSRRPGSPRAPRTSSDHG